MPERILVVEDEADLVESYERMLRRLGYGVIATGTRHEALDVIGREPLSLVILDIRLPDGDGLDLVPAARARAVPTLVVTGYASEETRAAALAAGAAGYLPKPFSASAFAAMVERTMREGATS